MMRSHFSSGYLNEMTYLVLTLGILETSRKLENGSINAEGAVTKKDYKVNKRVDRRYTAMIEKIESLISTLPSEAARKVKERHKKLYFEFLDEANKLDEMGYTMQLDLLAMYVLQVRFTERYVKDAKPLHEDFAWFNNAERYMQVADMVDGLIDRDTLNELMYDMAYRVARVL